MAADFHLVEGDLAVLIYIDVAVAGALLAEDGLVGHHHVLLRAEVHGHAGVHARAHAAVSVGQLHLHGEGVCCTVHRRVDQAHTALELLLTIGIHLDGHGRADLHLLEQAFGEVDVHLHGRDLLHLHHRQTAVKVAAVVVALRHHAGNRADQLRVLQQVVVGGLCHVKLGLHRVPVGLGASADFVELVDALEAGLEVVELRLGLLEAVLVHLHEHLALADAVADLNVDLVNAAARERGDVVHGVGLHDGGVFVGLLHFRHMHFLRADGHLLTAGGDRLFLFATAHQQHADCQ